MCSNIYYISIIKDNYVSLAVGELTPAQQRKFLKTGKIAFTAAQLKNNSHHLALHPANAKLFKKAKLSDRGVNIEITPGEVAAGLVHHTLGGSLHGGSLWSWLKNKAYPWIKENWSVIKPVVSKIADVAVPAAATFLGAPEAGVAVRTGLKALTGVGMKKGSDAAKQRMVHLRSLRKKAAGGSFIL